MTKLTRFSINGSGILGCSAIDDFEDENGHWCVADEADAIIEQLQSRIDELELAIDWLGSDDLKKEVLKMKTVTDISEYREPHSVINTGQAVHVMPTSLVNQIKAEGIREMVSKIKKDYYNPVTENTADLIEMDEALIYADKLEKSDD